MDNFTGITVPTWDDADPPVIHLPYRGMQVRAADTGVVRTWTGGRDSESGWVVTFEPEDERPSEAEYVRLMKDRLHPDGADRIAALEKEVQLLKTRMKLMARDVARRPDLEPIEADIFQLAKSFDALRHEVLPETGPHQVPELKPGSYYLAPSLSYSVENAPNGGRTLLIRKY